MKAYFDHMSSKPPHERRRHATQMAGMLTALLFVGWLGAWGISAGLGSSSTIANTANSQTAAAAQAGPQQGAQLIVATSSDSY